MVAILKGLKMSMGLVTNSMMDQHGDDMAIKSIVVISVLYCMVYL